MKMNPLELKAELERRRREEGIYFYKPHKYQRRFHMLDNRVRCFIAGNQQGKTYALNAEVVWFLMGTHVNPNKRRQAPTKGWILAPTSNFFREDIHDKLMSLVPRRMVKKYREKLGELELTNGSKVFYKSMAQGVGAHGGATLDFVAIHEEHGEAEHGELMARLLRKSGEMLMGFTPASGIAWVKRKLIDNKDLDCGVVECSGMVNPHISKKSFAQFAGSLTNRAEREVRLEGKFGRIEGLIFPEFDRSRNVIDEIPSSKLNRHHAFGVGIDTGKRFSAIWCMVDPDGIVTVFDSYYAEGNAVAVDCEAVKRISDGYGISPLYAVDPSSQIKADFFHQGMHVIDGEREFDYRVACLRDMIFQERFYVTENNVDLIEELENWYYKSKRGYALEYDDSDKRRPMGGYDRTNAMMYIVSSPYLTVPRVRPVEEEKLGLELHKLNYEKRMAARKMEDESLWTL